MSSLPHEPRKRRGIAVGSLLGITIGVIGLTFVVFRLVDGWSDVSAALDAANPSVVVAAILVGLIGMSIIGLNWLAILRNYGSRLPKIDGLRRYFIGQLGKYIPGGVWPIVGRAEMATRGGSPRAVAYSSTLISLATTYMAAVLLGAILFPFAGDRPAPAWLGVVLVTVPIGMLALHPRVIDRLVTAIQRVSKRDINVNAPRWSFSAKLVLLHLPAWLAITTATYLINDVLGGSEGFARIGFATCVSWFVGFVVVGLPGGVGVREAVFMTLAGTDPALGAAVALLARMVFILVDLLGVGATSLANTVTGYRNKET